MTNREAQWSKNSLPSRRKNETRFITATKTLPPDPYIRMQKRKPMGKSFFYGRGKYSAQTSFRIQDKTWYEQLLRQFTGSGVLPLGRTVVSGRATRTSVIGPLGMVAQSRCSSSWTQEKRHQLERPAGYSQSSTPEPEEEEPIFNIPSYRGLGGRSRDAPVVDLDKAEGERKQYNGKQSGDADNKLASEDATVKETGPKSAFQNSLETKLLDSPIYNLDWLKSLREKYETQAKAGDCDSAVLAEAKRLLEERKKKSKATQDDSVALRMKHLDLVGSEDEDEFDDEDLELPELLPEMENVIENALQPGPARQVLVDKFNTQITRHDVCTLAGLNWLNDEVINFYMNLVMDRSKNYNFPRVHAFSTFFYPKLLKDGYQSLRRWTRKVDVFSYDILLVPIHLGMHWCLATIDMRDKCVRYYDSMLSDNNQCLEALLRYLQDEHMDKKKSSYDLSSWTVENVKDIPQQMNGSDCGMFACMFAEYISRDSPINFDQRHMPYFRRKMVYEIVRATLL